MYEVLLHKAAERALKRLPKQDFSRVIVGIKALSNNPRPTGCRKLVGSEGDWHIRIGDYRVIYEIDDGTKMVRVFIVLHRREAYR